MESGAMVRMVSLGDTGLETSALGLGCADLFREPRRARRQRLLDVALEAGICHFDAAPMYGLGVVEGELGRFARGRRNRIVIATKFGIAPTPAARLLARVQGPLQRLLAAAPQLREQTRPASSDVRSGAIGTLLYRASGYDAAAARASLERSLRALRTDYVDILFLHDPSPGDVRSDEVRGYLESARTAGRIRVWGIAGEPDATSEVERRLGRPVPVLQLRGDVFERGARPVSNGRNGVILFGVLGRALPRILAHVRSDGEIRRRWSDAVGADCGRADELASLLLRDALRANERGSVLFSTTRVQAIHIAAGAAADGTRLDPGLDAFRTLVRDDLAAPEPAQ